MSTEKGADAGAHLRALGDRAVLVDLPDLAAVLAVRDALSAAALDGVDDIVPAARTLAVLFDPRRLSPETVGAWLERALGAVGARRASTETVAAEVVVDVVYDGEDLEEVARLAGVTVDELVERHRSASWRVAFNGFAPGFGYLVTDAEWFQVPRRASPRTSVPAGAVGLAGAFSGVYPREGPGGWQLIGRTDALLWRPRSPSPALLTPGTVVRFRAVDAFTASSVGDARAPAARGGASSSGSSEAVGGSPASSSSAGASRGPGTLASSGSASRDSVPRDSVPRDSVPRDSVPPASSPVTVAAFTVLDAGPQLLVEDLGRPGTASIGAGRSGALDRGALRLANRLVGNPEDAAGLEVLVGARLRFERSTWLAVTGARGALRLGGHPIEPDAAALAEPGDVLELGSAEHGLRYCVALRGGVRVSEELGSASSDVGASIGPAPLVDGDQVRLGTRGMVAIPAVDALTVWSPPDGDVDVRVIAGPREGWFAPASVVAFYEAEWEVTPRSNRVGVRLRSPHGVVLERADWARSAELPSEPMVPGAVQVPPSGEPTVLLADGPVTGGYPVVAVVADADLDLFAQLRPGQRMHFRHARRPRSLFSG